MSKGERFFAFFNYFIVIVFCLTIILPFINIFALSFNSGVDAQKGGVYFWPREWTLENFKEVFSQSNIVSGFYISVFRTILGTFLSVFLTAMAAYALKSKTLPGRKQITFFVFFTMLFSGGIVPYYMVLKELHLTNSIWVYIIPSLYSVWNIIIMRTFFNQIPDSVEEAARIDGCSDLAIFFKIILPMSIPVIAAISLFNAVGHWNDWFSGSFYVRDQSLKPLSTLLQEMLTRQEALQKALLRSSSTHYDLVEKVHITGESLKMATIVIVVTPIILVYPFLQKHFIKGVNIGSVKE
ncbi:carbohydrate ABC transporter permease [Lederbergia citrea]|uniref:Carbohydrate ABC transporter permease n=1 Tax=Lederbergia citrea TaxID=2833581 RepID=A0A942UTM5_9BACI|nr:carbohydrate ABC transporter permease [Lederbergia citrea]MBS4206220.1 carbohydrate ABC transporter permease [Lederbergia citrea]MBS4224846.1 carbohydrate ABC transporter permease [Lederbergia citrea]